MGKRRGAPHWVLFLLLASAFVSSLFSPSLSATTSSSDAAAMQAFAKAITPLPSSWDAASDPCSTKPRWEGVSCESGRVTVINLQSQSLQGVLPAEISKLSALRSLSLQHNEFGGDLPSLEKMANLQEIYLNDNNFSSIPKAFFSGLTGLINVSLDHNPLKDWSIPVDLSESANLGWFSAMNAGISGRIPEFFGEMVSLQMLRLSYNNLVGGIPVSFAGSGIKELSINNQNTKLSGRLNVLASMTQITTVMLQSNNFSGPIPDLSNCTLLTVLNLRDNRLTGVVPASLGSLPSLANLTLANNLLQGPFPDIKGGIWKDSQNSRNNFCKSTPGPCDARVALLLDVAEGFEYPELLATSWKGNDPCNKWLFVRCDHNGNITVLNFGNQGFGGTISPTIGEIKSLKTLILGDNNLRGTIPDSLTTLPELQQLDVSGNNLTGKIPTFSKNVVFNYTGNPLLGKDVSDGKGGSAGTVSDRSPTPNGSNSKSFSAGMVVLIVAIIIILVIAGTLASFMCRRRKRYQEHKKHGQVISNGSTAVLDLHTNYCAASDFHCQGNSTSSGIGAGSHVIEVESMYVSIHDLRQATQNFSEANVLGRGGFGVVYRGRQLDGTPIAVKRMECGEMGKKGMGEFEAEIAVLTKVRHRHLVALLGYCKEGNERLLVYEYMPQGTLGQHLFDANEGGKRSFLNWKQRLTIALDVARGLEYLHSLAQKSFIHRDLKPSNILLDDDMRAKVSDFGLVKLAPDGKYSVETRLAGTFGYLAPEYATTGRVTTKVDVYAFGVVLMELITGRKALDESLSDQYTHLVSWYRRVLLNKDSIKKSVDPKLDLEEEDFSTLYALAELAGHCTAREANQRPDMSHAVNVLAPLVDQWKPSTSDHEYSFNMSFDRSLPQRLRRWQENDDTSMMSLELDGAAAHGMENTQTSSISTRSDAIPRSR